MSMITSVQIEKMEAKTLIEMFNALSNKINHLTENLQLPQQDDGLITRKEVCELLGISYPTLGRWIKQDVLTAYRIGRKVRFKRTEVLEALESINQANTY